MEIRLHVTGYHDSDVEEQAELGWSLWRELLELDFEHLVHPSVPTPDGAKGGALEWAQLVVTAAGALPPLIAALRSWLRRHRGACITVTIDGDELTLTDPSSEERRQLLETWIRRHDRR